MGWRATSASATSAWRRWGRGPVGTAAGLGALVDIGRLRCRAIPPTNPPHQPGLPPADQAQVEDLASWARIQPVCNQVELHPMLAQRRLVEGCRRLVSGGRHGGHCAGTA